MHTEKIKILLVEDDFTLYNSIRNFFSDKGFAILSHPDKAFIDNYDDAVFVCKDIPHIAILDIEIKGRKNGFEVARYVKETFYCPIIFFTGKTTDLNRAQARKLAAGGFVKKTIKPYNEEQLFEDVQRLMPYAALADKIRTETINLYLQERVGKEFANTNIEWKKLMSVTTTAHAKNYTTLHLADNKTYQHHSSLKDIEKLLPPFFLKVDSGKIINSRFIKRGGKSPWQFLFNNQVLEVAATYRTDHAALILDEVTLTP